MENDNTVNANPWFPEKQWLPKPDWKGTWRDDWRIMGQEGYLMNKTLQWRLFDNSICVDDFRQCEFCWDTFDENTYAFFEPTQKIWICKKCFCDFSKHFNWRIQKQ